MASFLLQVPLVGRESNFNFLYSVRRSINSRKPTCYGHGLCRMGIDPVADFDVQQVIEKQLKPRDVRRSSQFDPDFLREAYQRCQNICAVYAKNHYLGTLLMTEETQKAIWAVYAWCRRADDLVDGPNSHVASSILLDTWEERLEDIFNGSPYDMLDSALTDTVQRFPLHIKPFKDMLEGMRMDTYKDRYENFGELYHYCYYVAGTTGLMTIPIITKTPESLSHARIVYHTALCLGIGSQLTNIIRDVREDASRGRIYLPQDELREFRLNHNDIFSRKVTDKWREFMKKQVTRARVYLAEAEQGATQLDNNSRSVAWSVLMMYRRVLDEIEKNDYDNLTKKAHIGRAKKLLTLVEAYAKANGWSQGQPMSTRR